MRALFQSFHGSRLITKSFMLSLVLAGLETQLEAAITNVSVVNITPGSFSVVWAGSASGNSTISVYADPQGATNLTSELAIEVSPLHTGNPTMAEDYERRRDQTILRQKTSSRGLAHLRVSRCVPGQTYYFKLQATNPGGSPEFWPISGPLPSVTTSMENSFVLQSRQLIFNVPGLDPAGSIILLSNSNTPSKLAAIAGDGVASNQVFFSVSDLIAATGNTNYLPLGAQEFTATVLDASSNAVAQKYSLSFTADFLVGQSALVDLGNYVVLNFGSTNLRAGQAGSLPITVNASSITNITFLLDLPTNRFSSLDLQSVLPASVTASLQPVSPGTIHLVLAAVPGGNLQGNQQVAVLNFVATANQSSTFAPVVPRELEAHNFDGLPVDLLAVQSGRIVIIGDEPLLEAFRSPQGGRSLALFGKPWASYALEYTTNLSNPQWQHLLRFPMTNLMHLFTGMDNRSGDIFYRAYEFAADPPLLETRGTSQNRSLLAYGRAGTNYTLQYATNLSGIVTWYPRMDFALTNSFGVLTNLGNPEPMIFYRLRRP